MSNAKAIRVAPIQSSIARDFIQSVHYSGTVVRNSQVHLGVFMNDRLRGVMQFGPPLDRRKILGLVRDSAWENVIELNRMAFDESLPRNSESRAIGVACRLFAKRAPQVKWMLSFADGAQCGDGTIYRAAGFVLTGIKPNGQIVEFPDGYRSTSAILTKPALATPKNVAARYGATLNGSASLAPFLAVGAKILPGYQFRYIRFLDQTWKERLTVNEIPFADIPSEARMYRGERRGQTPAHSLDDERAGR